MFGFEIPDNSIKLQVVSFNLNIVLSFKETSRCPKNR